MSSDAMRGGTIWPTMISTCVQNSASPHHAIYGGGSDGGAGFQPHASTESRSPAPAWHAQTNVAHPTAINNNNNLLSVKQEPMEQESYREYQDSGISATYTSDDGFISSSPSRHSEHSSRDSNQVALSSSPQSTDSRDLLDPATFYNSTPYNYHNNSGGYGYRSPLHHQQIAVAGHSSTLKSSPLHEVGSPSSRKTTDSPNLSEGDDSEFNYAKSDEETPVKKEIVATIPTNQSAPTAEDSVRDEPSFNSHGKLKTYKCKRCDHVSTTKYESWKHREEHIPTLKQMRCDQCPFVTEYKHYFEYHLRKHEGSKPFKCDKCEYACENKSMLTSHKKSHSTVYQFRCNDCEYATKYMHSLKQHLRKFTHRPAVVLNEDGTPNQTLIDVYGTRRGPRQRRTPNQIQQRHQQQLHQLPNTITPPLPTPETMHFMTSMLQDPVAVASLLNTSPEIMTHLMQNPLLMNGNPPLHLILSMLNSQRVPQQMEVSHSESESWECRECDFKADSQNSLKVHTDGEHSNTTSKECTSSKDWECHVCDFKTDDELSLKIHFGQEHGEPIVDVQVLGESDNLKDDNTTTSSALDLTNKSDSPIKNVTLNVPTFIRTEVPSILKERKNRRKGRAYKLDTMDQNSSDELEQQAQRTSSVIEHTQDVSKDETTADASNGALTCGYCEISFKFIGMYKVHMGYHGYRDPYTCNMCGVQCADKMAFYAHTLHERHG